MEQLTIELSAEELAALKVLAQRSNRTPKETAERLVVLPLIQERLITKSAERNGSKFVQLDE